MIKINFLEEFNRKFERGEERTHELDDKARFKEQGERRLNKTEHNFRNL